jgi:hypothetical protein
MMSSDDPSSIVAIMASMFGQNPGASPAQPPPLDSVFGPNRQTLGVPAFPQITLDESFRAAASRDPMIWAFVTATDKMNKGEK